MHTFFSGFSNSIRAYGQALDIITRERLWRYALMPGIVSLAFSVFLFFAARYLATLAGDALLRWYPWETGIGLVRSIVTTIGTISVWVVAVMMYKYVVLILSAPFMSPLSAKVEALITGQSPEHPGFHIGRASRELFRGIRVSLRNLIRELWFLLLLVILVAIFPLIAPVNGLLAFAIQAYYAGFGNIDYTMERHFSIRQSVVFVRDHKGMTIGNGTVFLLLLMIPVAGVFLAPSLATVAGTVETVEKLNVSNRDLIV